MNKIELRQEIRNRKKMYTREQLADMSRVVTDRLMKHPLLLQAQTIMLYHSLPDEVDTRQCIDRLHALGKQIVLPKVTGEGEMEIRKYQGPSSVQPGAFGIMEPVGDVFTDYDQIDLAIVPGMSFDSKGNRLGRGKGYYDRFLAQVPQLYKLGICFDFQKTDDVPCEKTDIQMDEVL